MCETHAARTQGRLSHYTCNREEFRARKERVSGAYLGVSRRISAYLGTKMAQIRDFSAVSEALGLGKQAQIRGDTPRYVPDTASLFLSERWIFAGFEQL